MKLWRSLVFWGGVVVMALLGWGWWDSTRAGSSLENDPHWALWSIYSEIRFMDYGDFPGVEGEWRIGRDGQVPPNVRMSMELPRVYPREGGVHIVVPHFWLLLGAAGAWGVCLWWRWRRIRQARGRIG